MHRIQYINHRVSNPENNMAAGKGHFSTGILLKDYKRIQESPNEYYSVGLVDGNIYTWEVLIFGPRKTPYENGIFKAVMLFPASYPDSPPTFRFCSKMWHPNIDENGNVCISILHDAGEDKYGYESLGDRWLPVRTPESIIISIITLLTSPNCESPANVDAARHFRENEKDYRREVMKLTAMTLEEYDDQS